MSPWIKKSSLTSHEVAQILEDFLEGKGAPFAWDDFTQGMSFEDEHLESIRARCARLDVEFPAENPKEYCNARGRDVIREYIRQLQAGGTDAS